MGITRRRLIQAAGFAAGGLGTVSLSQMLQGCNQRSLVNTTFLEFDVVTVDAIGEEIERTQGEAKYHTEDLGDGVMLEMASIPGGSFLMGSPTDEEWRYPYEGPVHQVRVPAFFMGKYPVTQAQWRVVAAWPQIRRKLNPDPSHFKGDDRPVEKISWLEATEFCARLSEKTGWDYRLPTEAEREYACRAGTTTPFHFGATLTTDLANYNGRLYDLDGVLEGEDREETTPVGYFEVANAFGLYDMHGNVHEWCFDHWHENYQGAPTDGTAWTDKAGSLYRVFRGGSWYNDAAFCRSANRAFVKVRYQDKGIGFRVACSDPRT